MLAGRRSWYRAYSDRAEQRSEPWQTNQPSAIDDILAEYAGLEQQMSDPALHNDPTAARRIGKRFSELAPIMADVSQAHDCAGRSGGRARTRCRRLQLRRRDPRARRARSRNSRQTLTDLLAPRDPHDGDDVVLEVKSGEGGEESALFASDLARMYVRYAERHGWQVEILESSTSDLGGYKDATLSIKSQW